MRLISSRVLLVCVLISGFVVAAGYPSSARAQSLAASIVRVPILMYHYVRVNPVARDRIGADLSVTPQHFAQQMAFLASHGFHTITLDDLMGAIYNQESLPSRPVILTFDDGYEDFYTDAYPVMRQYGFKSTSFIITGFVGTRRYMSWAQIVKLHSEGLVSFEDHTVDHSDMGRMSAARANIEMARSKASLESLLGTPVRYIAYPSGHYDAAVLSLLHRDGFVAGIGTAYGSVHGVFDLSALTRVRIHGTDTLASFAQKLGVPVR